MANLQPAEYDTLWFGDGTDAFIHSILTFPIKYKGVELVLIRLFPKQKLISVYGIIDEDFVQRDGFRVIEQVYPKNYLVNVNDHPAIRTKMMLCGYDWSSTQFTEDELRKKLIHNEIMIDSKEKIIASLSNELNYMAGTFEGWLKRKMEMVQVVRGRVKEEQKAEGENTDGSH